MNFLDVDFPGVTEAYQGSLEDWQELFERYAFPIGKETDTSIEMKRYLKRNPEATYEDWLDRVIKFVRDEIWYEEKINLSIRELYLVVNKVTSFGKKLRAFYTIAFNTEITNLTEAQNAGIAKTKFFAITIITYALQAKSPNNQELNSLFHKIVELLTTNTENFISKDAFKDALSEDMLFKTIFNAIKSKDQEIDDIEIDDIDTYPIYAEDFRNNTALTVEQRLQAELCSKIRKKRGGIRAVHNYFPNPQQRATFYNSFYEAMQHQFNLLHNQCAVFKQRANNSEAVISIKSKELLSGVHLATTDLVTIKEGTVERDWYKLSLFTNKAYDAGDWQDKPAIYCIRNFLTGQSYYGLANNLLKRTQQHATGRVADSPSLHMAIKAAKSDSQFRIALFESCPYTSEDSKRSWLRDAEKETIKNYNTYNGYAHYNLSAGGQLGSAHVIGLAQVLPYLAALATNTDKTYSALEGEVRYDHKTLMKYDLMYVSDRDRANITTTKTNVSNQVLEDIKAWLALGQNEAISDNIINKLEEINDQYDSDLLQDIFEALNIATKNKLPISPFYRRSLTAEELKMLDTLNVNSSTDVSPVSATHIINELPPDDKKSLLDIANEYDNIAGIDLIQTGPLDNKDAVVDFINKFKSTVSEVSTDNTTPDNDDSEEII